MSPLSLQAELGVPALLSSYPVDVLSTVLTQPHTTLYLPFSSSTRLSSLRTDTDLFLNSQRLATVPIHSRRDTDVD